ncbi:hypothetical protein K437DRAFT_257736 [Tilletiaria anomala UBC 951]|uniref:Uncharacterized protein n=1 Tax=Tilletiaria anomala (strain ATCC 24038 / CBS 436.72 / UBC 951) TaxID=1037660 RepID=A0A066VV83_TILAU|nr:uncharacterized protein K437DRAFT_257736 [Tilletiaria anomala UBC 951]KDN42719.1 hypothetical protein K437DRAFT_257736 [Tilletiaria anomala UBC 951]
MGPWMDVPERFLDDWYRLAVPYTIPNIVAGWISTGRVPRDGGESRPDVHVYAAAHGAALHRLRRDQGGRCRLCRIQQVQRRHRADPLVRAQPAHRRLEARAGQAELYAAQLRRLTRSINEQHRPGRVRRAFRPLFSDVPPLLFLFLLCPFRKPKSQELSPPTFFGCCRELHIPLHECARLRRFRVHAVIHNRNAIAARPSFFILCG